MLTTLFPSNMSTLNPSQRRGDSTASIIAQWSSDETHFVDIWSVVKDFNGITKRLGFPNRVKDINTRVAVSQAAVVVRGDVEGVGVADLE